MESDDLDLVHADLQQFFENTVVDSDSNFLIYRSLQLVGGGELSKFYFFKVFNLKCLFRCVVCIDHCTQLT